MMHTESHIFSALSMTCVLKITVLPRRLSSTTASLSACALIGSRPLNGSSRITRSGSCSSVAMNCTFCCMPRDSSSTFASPQSLSARREAEPLEPFVDARAPRSRALHAFELGEEQQHAAHLHLLVEAALFGQVADAVEHAERSVFGRPKSEIVPGVGRDDVEDHADRRRLAGAVGAEQAVHRSARHLERQVANRDVLLVPLHDIANVDREVGHVVDKVGEAGGERSIDSTGLIAIGRNPSAGSVVRLSDGLVAVAAAAAPARFRYQHALQHACRRCRHARHLSSPPA